MKSKHGYEMGDKLVVRDREIDTWLDDPRIFIKDGQDGGVICVDVNDSKSFLNGGRFKTTHWQFHKLYIEPKKEPKFVAPSFLAGKWIGALDKDCPVSLVVGFSKDSVWVSHVPVGETVKRLHELGYKYLTDPTYDEWHSLEITE